MMSVSSFFVIDNRQLSHRSFNAESSHASFHRYVKNIIGKLITLNVKHRWIELPSALIVAQTPDKGKVFNKSQCDLSQLSNILEPVYSCVGGVSIPKLTWGSFIIDSLQKIGKLIQQQEQIIRLADKKFMVVIFSTDICLIGDQCSQSIDESLEKFCQVCTDISKHVSIEIRVVCTIISDSVNSVHFDNPNLFAIHSRLKALGSLVTFQQVLNSAMHFEEELRMIIAAHQVPLLSKLQFPIVQNVDCSVLVELSASTLSGVDGMHTGLASPELCSLVNRAEIDPLFLEGRSCVVRCPAFERSKHLLPSRARYLNNMLVILCKTD
jgi:hypothetical protein